MTPQEIYIALNKTVIGQSDYLEKLSVSLWLHDQRIRLKKNGCTYHTKLPQIHLLAVGPTGTGKTLALQTAARLLKFDLVIADMSFFTASGWRGRNIGTLFHDLFEQCGKDIARAEKAVVFLDEIDKSVLGKMTREEYSDSSIEKNLLKILEGSMVPVDEKGEGSAILNTENMLFICAGAFEGIENIIQKRLDGDTTIGFGGTLPGEEQKNILLNVTKDDLAEYGMGRQLLGRFGSVTALSEMTERVLADILMYSDSSIVHSFDRLLSGSNIRVDIDREGALAVARKALEQKTGARGLTDIITNVLHDTLFLMCDAALGECILLTADKSGEPLLKFSDVEPIEQELVVKEKAVKLLPIRKQYTLYRYAFHILTSCGCLTQTQPFEVLYAIAHVWSILFLYIQSECSEEDYHLGSLETLWDIYINDPELFFGIVGRKNKMTLLPFKNKINRSAAQMSLHALREYQRNPGTCKMYKQLRYDQKFQKPLPEFLKKK